MLWKEGDLRPQLLLFALRVPAGPRAAGREGALEDSLGLACALPEERIAFEIVLLCSRRSAQLAEIVL